MVATVPVTPSTAGVALPVSTAGHWEAQAPVQALLPDPGSSSSKT